PPPWPRIWPLRQDRPSRSVTSGRAMSGFPTLLDAGRAILSTLAGRNRRASLLAKIAMKFGGTSVADLDRIRHVATLVKRERDKGNEVAVVVSAMAGETNKLVAWCNDIARAPGSNAPAIPDPREYDVIVAAGEQVTCGLLAVALGAIGVPA